MGHRKMPAYGEREHGGRYILDEYDPQFFYDTIVELMEQDAE